MSDEKDDKWEMPKPVFRSTGGSVPRNLEDTISLSFAPNKETIEIDEDDDILGIMGQNDADRSFQASETSHEESILETEPEAASEAQTEIESPAEARPEIAAEPESVVSEPVAEPIPPAAIHVSPRDIAKEPKKIDSRRADQLTYVAMVIIGVGLFIAAIYYYFWPPPPVR